MIEILKQLSIILSALSALLNGGVPVNEVVFGAVTTIESKIENKTQEETKIIKSQEIPKYNHIGTYTNKKYGITAEIKSVTTIPNGGIEIIARAWRESEPLGFGKDQSIEWQRFRIWNPPILTDDPNGTIVREWMDRNTGAIRQLKLREDPVIATQNTLAHIIKNFSSPSPNIIKGSTGNTIDTFFPEVAAGTVTADGSASYDSVNASWATVHDHAGNASQNATAIDSIAQIQSTTDSGLPWRILIRSIYTFATGDSIPTTDTIASSTFSVYGDSKLDAATAINPTYNVFLANPADSSNIVNSDYAKANFGTTGYSTAITQANFSTTGYNDFLFNSTGNTAIQKGTGAITEFGIREATYDAISDSGTEPAWSSAAAHYAQARFADQAGTDTDPKLSVDHTASAVDSGGKGLKIIMIQ